MAEGAAAQQLPLFVVLFPNLVAVAESGVMIQSVIDLFQEQGASVLDVQQTLQRMTPPKPSSTG